MPEFSNIEERLAALMPRDVSPSGRESLNALIDDLAADISVEEISSVPTSSWGRWWSVAAACVALLGAGVAVYSTDSSDQRVQQVVSVSAADEAIDFVSMDSSEVVERLDDINADSAVVLTSGASWPVRSLRYHVVTQSKLKDQNSGIVVTVSEPSEERVLLSEHTF